MKHLKGFGRRYFSLAIIAMYSTVYKLSSIDVKFKYHVQAFEYEENKTSPPIMIFNSIK